MTERYKEVLLLLLLKRVGWAMLSQLRYITGRRRRRDYASGQIV